MLDNLCLTLAVWQLFHLHKVNQANAVEETETVSLEVDPSSDHPLDDADKALYDPRFTEASIAKHSLLKQSLIKHR